MMLRSYPHIGRKEVELDAAWWAARYAAGDTDWDHGQPSPGLVDFLENDSYRPGRVLVPGCGPGHDARALGRAGFDVTGLDVVGPAVQRASALARAEVLENVRFERADFFRLPAPLRGPYDWIFEHTFFCAIDPELRDRYTQTIAELLPAGGHFLGIFYIIQPESGPPFGTSREELLDRLGPLFRLKLDRVPRSFPHRAGKELLLLGERK